MLALLVLISAAAHAQTNPPSAPPERSVRCSSPANPHKLYFECVGRQFDFIEHTLTQDWGGFRSELNRLGITPTASYTTQLLGNPSGGQSRGFTYSGTLQASIFWDLDKLMGVPGLSFHSSAAWSTGKSLSTDYVENIFPVQSAYTAPGNGTNNLTLGELYLQQQLFNKRADDCGGTPGGLSGPSPPCRCSISISTGESIPFQAISIINDPTFTTYPPGVEWGVQALYNLSPRFQFAVGVFNTNQSSAAGAKGGLDFSFQQGNRGALSVVQANYLFNQAPEDMGLPGQYSFGGFYDGNRFTSLSNVNASEVGTYSVYGLLQQMVYRDGDANSQKGLTVWAETAIAPKSNVNTMPYFVGGGLSYQGVIPGRGQGHRFGGDNLWDL